MDSRARFRRVLLRRIPSHLAAHHAQLTGRSLLLLHQEISRFRRLFANDPPGNFLWCYSLGGKEDHLIDLSTERHADVFPNVEALIAADYTDQTESDLLSVLSESPLVGIPANRIPHLLKKQGQETFGSLQRARDEKLRAKKARAGQKFALAH